MKGPLPFTSFTFIFLIFTQVCLGQNSPSHPMDPLTSDEYSLNLKVLQNEGHLNDGTRFPIVQLQEMPKTAVLNWKEGDPIDRRAFSIVKQGPQVVEAIVNLNEETLESWKEIKGVQPSFLMQDYLEILEACEKSANWKASMEKRGYTSFENIFAYTLSVGNFGEKIEEERRIV